MSIKKKSDPQAEFTAMWRWMAAQRSKMQSWADLPRSKQTKYDAAAATAWGVIGPMAETVDGGDLARLAWEIWLRMPAVPER